MDTREVYRQKYEAQLSEWGDKVSAMKAQAEKLSAQAKLDLKPHIDAVREKFAAAGDKVKRIADAGDDRWTDVARDVDRAWTDFTASVQGAYDAIAKHKKS